MIKTSTKIIAGFFCIVAIANQALSQENYFHCGTDQMVKQALDNNPALRQSFLEEQTRLETIDRIATEKNYQSSEDRALLPVYVIPIVFHILHVYGTENISDAQVKDEVRILNEDYRKLNSNFINTVSTFTAVAADCEIEFRLAQKDPNGNCTNGIDRIYSTLTNSGDDNAKLNYWDRSKYLNVWVVKTMSTAGVAGYAYLPNSATTAQVDGIIILSTYIGSIGTGNPTKSHALTHEIGHFFNLKHTWGSTNSPGVSCGNDGVTDTPVTMGHTTCPLTDAVCTSGVIENVQNYMEYSYCSTMFTAGQKTRMRSAITSNTAQRSSLITTTTASATGLSTPTVLCGADFTNNTTTNSICEGDSITFTSSSFNAHPTGWSWVFAGGIPATSTDSTPTVHYNTSGVYSVSLTLSDASGNVTANKPNYIFVSPTQATYSNTFYSEGFEGSAIPNSDWRVNNFLPGGSAWVQTSAASVSGTKSVMIANTAAASGNVDELISPSIDMTALTGSNTIMTFKVAFAQRTTSSADKLQVFVSTNCGKTWTQRKIILGSFLSTGGVQTNNFVPTSSQWSSQTVSLSGYQTITNLLFLFRFTSNGGNNIYIDDINIGGATSINEQSEATINFQLFPNPTEGNSNLSFNLTEKQNVSIKIYDIVGREISIICNSLLSQGIHQFNIDNNSTLSSGIYFVQLIADNKKQTRKLIIK